jgi:hypothetical protein
MQGARLRLKGLQSSVPENLKVLQLNETANRHNAHSLHALPASTPPSQ